MRKQKNFKDKNIEELIMKSIHIRTWMNLIATLIGITGIILVKLFEDWAMTILWIEIVVLPVIYLIGNAYIEEKLKQEYEETLSVIDDDARKWKEKFYELVFENQGLRYKLYKQKK